MTVKQKVETYLATHKRPITSDVIANHYLIRKESVMRALNALEKEGIARSKRLSQFTIWGHRNTFR